MINIQENAFFTVRDRNNNLRMTKVVAENTNTFYIISLTVFISIIPHQYFLCRSVGVFLKVFIFSMINVQLSAVIIQVFFFFG